MHNNIQFLNVNRKIITNLRDACQIKKSLTHRSPLTVRAYQPAQDIRYFGIFPAHVDDVIRLVFRHIRG